MENSKEWFYQMNLKQDRKECRKYYFNDRFKTKKESSINDMTFGILIWTGKTDEKRDIEILSKLSKVMINRILKKNNLEYLK